MSFVKEYAMGAAKKYAVNSTSENYSHGNNNMSGMEHNHPYGNTMSEISYERRLIEKPVVYERVEAVEFVRPVGHHHHEQLYYEPAERRAEEYVEYERGSEYDRDGYARHGRTGGY